jgi:GGDEF domain-containing protein
MVIKKILSTVRNDKVIFEDKVIKYSVSIGAVDCLDKKDIDEVIKIADELLYEVKGKGRNCACFMTEGEKESIN